jgi:hypothetical protein
MFMVAVSVVDIMGAMVEVGLGVGLVKGVGDNLPEFIFY